MKADAQMLTHSQISTILPLVFYIYIHECTLSNNIIQRFCIINAFIWIYIAWCWGFIQCSASPQWWTLCFGTILSKVAAVWLLRSLWNWWWNGESGHKWQWAVCQGTLQNKTYGLPKFLEKFFRHENIEDGVQAAGQKKQTHS